MEFIQKNGSKVAVIFILILAVFLRFYNYPQRFGLAHDQAAFAITARHALESLQLPLFGPFSSGGPFQTGGEWYWLVTLGTMLYPPAVISPWVFLTALTVLAVFLMVVLGKELIDKKFGLMLGLLTAVSTAQIAQSTNLTNQTPIIIFSVLALIFMAKYLKTKKVRFLFWQSFSIGIAASIHIQGVALLPLVFLTVIFGKINPRWGIPLVILGIVLPWVPVLIADSQNSFYNTKNMLTYYSSSQAQVPYEVLGRRWLTFINDFMPLSWGFIVGGSKLAGVVSMIFVAGAVVFSFFKKNLSKKLVVIILSTLLMFAVLRYTRTPLFESFFVFIHPFIIVLSGWVLYLIMQQKKAVGILAFAIIVLLTLYKDLPEIRGGANYTPKEANSAKEELISLFPNGKFAIYDYQFKTTINSLSLVLFLASDNKISDNGQKIGITNTQQDLPIIEKREGYTMFDLSGVNDVEIKKWALMNPSEIYHSTQTWYKNK